jgi:hypothetical protein
MKWAILVSRSTITQIESFFLANVHAQQLLVGTFVSSFRHERTSIGGKIYTKMQMQDLFDGYTLINYKPFWQSRGVFVGHIHLDKNTFSILFHKRTICNSLLIILFDGDCVHIYVNNSTQVHQSSG